jgi:pilus assembly protein CpaB
MNKTRIVVLAVAAVAGAGAFYMMMTGQTPTPKQIVTVVEASKEKTVRILVADRDFQRGDRLGSQDVRWATWPEHAVSTAYITDRDGGELEQVAKAVARSLIVKGEPIIESKIVRAGNAGQMAAILTPGMRAVTMRVSPETASGGFILPGDRVDVLNTESAREATSRTRTIFENVRVLAVNAVYSETPEQAHMDGVNVTLELTPSDAESFVTARSTGMLSLTLRSVFQPDGELESQTRRSSDVTVIRYGRS